MTTIHGKDLNEFVEFIGLRLGLLDGGVGLLDKRCIVLRHLVISKNTSGLTNAGRDGIEDAA